MSLPEFNQFGDLAEGVYPVSLAEVVARFGTGSPQRQEVTNRLKRIWDLAVRTGFLDRLVLFGSYVSDKVDPDDVDIVLVLRDDFRPVLCPADALALLDHQRAEAELGASIFWVRPGMLLGEPLEEFIAHWQVKRDGRRRGILEVRP
jgi:hypothetical protein